MPFPLMLARLLSLFSHPFSRSFIPVHPTGCSFSEMNEGPVGVRGWLQEGFLSPLIFLLCSRVPSLKVRDIGGQFREEPVSRASVLVETTASSLATSDVSLSRLGGILCTGCFPELLCGDGVGLVDGCLRTWLFRESSLACWALVFLLISFLPVCGAATSEELVWNRPPGSGQLLGMAEATLALESDSEGKSGMTLGKCPSVPSLLAPVKAEHLVSLGDCQEASVRLSCEAPASVHRHPPPQ